MELPKYFKHRGMEVQMDQVRPRECLKCDKEFMSKGPHNRLCNGCASVNASHDNDVVGNGCSRTTGGPGAVSLAMSYVAPEVSDAEQG